jgi:threonine dehydratase
MIFMEITKQHIEEAHKRIKPFIHKTPVLHFKNP